MAGGTYFSIAVGGVVIYKRSYKETAELIIDSLIEYGVLNQTFFNEIVSVSVLASMIEGEMVSIIKEGFTLTRKGGRRNESRQV